MRFTDPADLDAIGAVPISGLTELHVGDLLLSALRCDDNGELDFTEAFYSFLVLEAAFMERLFGMDHIIVNVLPITSHDPLDTEPREYCRQVNNAGDLTQLFRVPRRCSS